MMKSLQAGRHKSRQLLSTFQHLTLFGSLFFSVSLSAADAQNCKPDLIAKPQAIPAAQENAETATKQLEGDRLTQPNIDQYQLAGKASLKQPGLVVLSDQINYDKNSEVATLTGHVELHQTELLITAEQATINNAKNQALLDNTQYQILPSRTHGKSHNIEIDDKSQQAKLAEASLTTCKVNEDDSVDWDLKFDKLIINNQTRRVVGKNTTLYFKDVPIFYTPYFDYPLDDRASGLLFPEFGSYKPLNQSEAHQYLILPYYFNIAPNIDDTLTLIPITDRGLALENEFRYLAKHNHVIHSAELTLTGLQDQVVSDQGLALADTSGNISYGDSAADRWRAKLLAHQNWGQGFTSQIDWEEVSDKVFFKDTPVQKELETATQKKRFARIDYRQGNFHAYSQLLSYLRLENAPTNYEKRPEIGLSYYQNYSQFNFDVNANMVDFYVPISNHSKPEGLRLHITPKIEHSIQKSYGHLTTTLQANFTQYTMQDNGFNPSTESSISRSIPQFAVRGGLIFERDLQLAGHSYIQTLEPELQYLYTPYEDQQEIALFDTANRSLAFSNLFALNRFTGADRIGDSNQVTMALTSRLLSAQGKQIAEAGVGQIAYLEDREVTLTNTSPETAGFSDLFVKLNLNLDNWYFSSTSKHARDDFQLTASNTRVKWHDQNSTVLINHTLNNLDLSTETEMLSFGAYTKIAAEWELGLYSSYDLHKEDIYETELGLRYDSCCWSAEIVAERTQLENGLYNDGIQIQFELKGLSSSSTRFKNEMTDKLNF